MLKLMGNPELPPSEFKLDMSIRQQYHIDGEPSAKENLIWELLSRTVNTNIPS